MKAQELKIGNWVYEEVGITALEPMQVDIHDITELYFVPDKFKPIELTEEWLVKFGFDENKDKLYGKNWLSPEDGYGNRKRILPCVNKITYIWQYSDYNNVIIKHVHQLQNLYFALTGEEL